MKDGMTGPKTTEEYFDRVKTLCVALLGEGADADSAVLRVFERMNQSEGGICGDADLYRMVYDTVCSISAGRDDTPTDRAIAASLIRNNVRGALGELPRCGGGNENKPFHGETAGKENQEVFE